MLKEAGQPWNYSQWNSPFEDEGQLMVFAIDKHEDNFVAWRPVSQEILKTGTLENNSAIRRERRAWGIEICG